MIVSEARPASRKAIPPARDRLQSRLLVWIATPLISLAYIQLIFVQPVWDLAMAKAFALSAAFALATWVLRAATPGAACIGGMVCFLLTASSGSIPDSPFHSALTPLIALLVLTFLATRTGRDRKFQRGLAESRKGRRASQVIANLGIAALLSNLAGANFIAWLVRDAKNSNVNPNWFLRILSILLLAALAEAAADTVSSEIGQAFGGKPILLTTFRRTETGVDGAISLTGTLAGVLAAAIVAAAGLWSMHLHANEFWIVLTAATLGLVFDSLLGATVERHGYLGNDLVNFTSTAFAAAICLLIVRSGDAVLPR